MIKILKFNSFLLETLNSYDIKIIDKKLDKFFKENGFKRKHGNENTKTPYFQIITDIYFLKKEISELENPSDMKIDLYKKHNISINDILEKRKKELSEYKKGDIFIYTSRSNKINHEFINNLLNIIESSGYFIATAGISDKKLKDKTKIKEHLLKYKKISISIEPYYDKKIDFDGEYLYHTTPKKNLEKILKIGLNPKSKNTVSFYPERIYLSPDEVSMISILGQLKDKKIDEEYVKLKIKKFDGLNLYKDLRFSGGLYTYNSIHPKYISVM